MADSPVVHIGENSPEKIALKLFEVIASVEKKALYPHDASDLSPGWAIADREWILSTYVDALEAVRHGIRPSKK